MEVASLLAILLASILTELAIILVLLPAADFLEADYPLDILLDTHLF